MAYTIEWQDQGVYIRQYGNVDFADMVKMQISGYGNPNIDAVKYIIWDGSLISQISLKTIDLKNIASQDVGASYWKKDILHATVSRTKEVQQVCKNYIEILESIVPSWTFRNFSSAHEAENWIQSHYSPSLQRAYIC